MEIIEMNGGSTELIIHYSATLGDFLLALLVSILIALLVVNFIFKELKDRRK